VLFHMAATSSLRRQLEELAASIEPSLRIAWCDEDDDARLGQLLPEAEVIWHLLRPLGAKEFDAAPKLRLVQKLGSGVNTIDLEEAGRRGIAVSNMPGTNAPAVAEATVGLMLSALRWLPTLDAATRAGRGWPTDPSLFERAAELAGATVGLVGHGAIAQRVHRVLDAFDARVLYTTETPRPTEPGWRPLDELLVESDIVSLHVPATPATNNLLDDRRLALLRPGAVIVNTARGSLVDDAALIAALRRGQVAAAALDVFTTEPLPVDHPLLALPNVVVTPHIAWVTAATMRRCVQVAAENCVRLASGAPLHHQVV